MVSCREVKLKHNICLHDVIQHNRLELLNLYLLRENVQLNCLNSSGYTALYMSIHKDRSDEFIMRMFQAGCDITITDDWTLLHMAVTRDTNVISQELIKRGMDVDAQNAFAETPLQIAIKRAKLDAVCLLLENNADVTIPDYCNATPIMNALKYGDEDIAEALFQYYDDFSCVDIEINTALTYAVNNRSPLTAVLIDAGADVNIIPYNGRSPLVRALEYGDFEMFNLIWPKLQLESLLKNRRPFLWTFLNRCRFPISEWLQCFYQLLTSSIAGELVDEIKNYHTCGAAMTADLLFALIEMGFVLEDRLAVIYLFLSVANTIHVEDIELTLRLYGFREEVTALMYAGNFQRNYKFLHLLPLPTFVLALEGKVTTDLVYKLFSNQIRLTFDMEDIILALGFFGIPLVNKNKLIMESRRHFKEKNQKKIKDKLNEIPSVPSLLELSRNKTRQLIKNTNTVQKPYEFHDAVKKMILPQKLKDILTFRISPYWR